MILSHATVAVLTASIQVSEKGNHGKHVMNVKISNRSAYLAALLATTCIACGPTAFAQDANEDEASNIDQIIVTAGRREQSLQDVPASVAAIAPEDFTLRGLTDVKSILQYVPGITVTDSGNPGTGFISARGVPQAGATAVFGIYVDDTPLTSSTGFGGGSEVFFDASLMDIERVEVIKGPQGTLYGATSVGGMLRYISREPALEEIRVSASAYLLTVKHGGEGYIVRGRVSAPIVKGKLGITLSGYRDDAPGYVDYVDAATGDVLEKDADGSVTEAYAADILFTPTEDFKIRFKYMKQEMDTALSSTVALAGTDSDDGAFGDYANFLEPGAIILDYEVMSGNLTYDFGGATLTSTTSYSEYTSAQESDVSNLAFLVDLLGLQPPGVTTTGLFFNEAEGAERMTQEIRLTSNNSEKLEWIAGFFYADEETFTTQELASVPVVPGLADVSFPSDYKEYAGFGDVTYYLTENFDLTAGVRISKTKVTVDFFQSGPFVGPTIDNSGEIIKDTVDTYLFAARYRIHEDLSLYSRVASGYRPVQGNLPLFSGGGNAASSIVESDNAWSYEIGAKGSFADGKADFDIAVWKIDWSNFQALFTFGGGVTTSANAAGGLSAHGFEGSFNFRPSPALTLTANLGFTDSSLNEDEPEIGGVKGKQYPDLPRWKGSFQWNYLVDLSSDWSANFGGGVRYRGSFTSGFPDPEGLTGDLEADVSSAVVADLNLDISNGRYGIGVYATNLFDKRAIRDRTDNFFGGNSDGVFERPRTIGVTMRVDF